AGTAAMAAATVTGGCAWMTGFPPLPQLAYVGCYTSPQRQGRGEGISVYRIDPASAAWTLIQVMQAPANPSWLALERRRRVLYSAHGDGEAITAFRVNEATGRLGLMGMQDAKGTNGVRLGVDANNRFLVCANYASGTVTVLPIIPDGSLGPATDLVT